MIKKLRKLGGTWEAHRNGMGGWYYTGNLNGHAYEVRAYAHIAPRFDGDDEGFDVLWHTTRDGKPWGYATRYPINWLPDEAKDQGARDVLRRCKAVLNPKPSV